MLNLIKFTRLDDCPKCRSSKTIECYDINNNPINYSYLLDLYIKDKSVLNKLNNRVLSYMRCKKCREVFEIYWDENREIPIPLNRILSIIHFDKFLDLYK